MPEHREHLTARLRASFAICIAACLLLILGDLRWQPADRLPVLLFVKALQIGGLLVGWWLVALPASVAHRGLVGAAVLTMMMVTTGAAGVVRGDYLTMILLALGGSIGAATFIPWGGRAQCWTATGAAITLVGCAVLLHDDPLARNAYPAIAVGLALAGSVWVAHEHEERRQERDHVARLLAGQSRLLEMVATGAMLPDVLHALCVFVEERAPGMLCSVLLLDGQQLRDGAAPSLPRAYRRAIDGVTIGPDVGSCGAAAALRVPVIVEDIATDPRWTAFRDLAAAHDLAACWSAPIVTSERECLGTLAMYYRERRAPKPAEWQLLQAAAHLAGVAITRARNEDALARSRARLEDESRISRALVRVGQEMISSLNTPVILQRLSQLTTELLGCDSSSTVLRDPQDHAFVVRSTHGYGDEAAIALQSLRMPGELLSPILEHLAQRQAIQVVTARIDKSDAARLLRQFGIGRSLYVALRRGDEVIGLLSAATRDPGRAFSVLEERIAFGIAQFAAVALENARLVEELRTATQLKSEFVSTMSHELRTPLSVIIGYTDMLSDAELPAEERLPLLRAVHRQSLELLELIEATLSLNRLDSGRDTVQLEPVAVGDLIDALAADYAAMPRPPGATLSWQRSAPAQLRTDPRKLRIVLKNLVGNALKFTPSGSVVVSYHVDGTHCRFVVQDTGVGIQPSQLPVIFEMFRQGDGSDSRSFSGVGLGLYIVQRLVTQLGGTIAVTSEPGRGSTFTVSLPLEADVPLAATA